jgi:hypothetical protein
MQQLLSRHLQLRFRNEKQIAYQRDPIMHLNYILLL